MFQIYRLVLSIYFVSATGDISGDCTVFEDDTLPVNHEETLVRAEVCLCKNDL